MTRLFDKFEPIKDALRSITDCGLDSINIVMERVLSPTEAIINGRRTILAGTNNYLGITFDPECIEAACKALREEGTGTTGSRMANGTYAGHVALEQELAEFFDKNFCIVFSTGFTANLAMLGTLAGPDDVILLDADCHASIYDGCRLSGAQFMLFRHNDPDNLEKRLKRLKDRSKNTLIVIEGLYSMRGDRAVLQDIVDIKNRYGACLMVDEAHSLGVLGEHGRGLAEEVSLEDHVDFVVGTFSKSLGSIGGFCVSNHQELDLLRYASRPYIFTASPSPAVIASTRVALKRLRTRPELRSRLWENARNLYQRLHDMNFSLGPEPSPIIAVCMKDKEQTLRVWSGLLERGVYVNMVLPPATPDAYPLLRCSMSAAHTPEQVDMICDSFSAFKELAAI